MFLVMQFLVGFSSICLVKNIVIVLLVKPVDILSFI